MLKPCIFWNNFSTKKICHTQTRHFKSMARQKIHKEIGDIEFISGYTKMIIKSKFHYIKLGFFCQGTRSPMSFIFVNPHVSCQKFEIMTFVAR